MFPKIKTVLRIKCEDFNLLNLFTYLLMRSIFNNALSQKMSHIIIIIIIIRGTPKLTWAEGIRGLMAEKGLMEEDWNDRSNWRNGRRKM
jgi:hypothetical protein